MSKRSAIRVVWSSTLQLFAAATSTSRQTSVVGRIGCDSSASMKKKHAAGRKRSQYQFRIVLRELIKEEVGSEHATDEEIATLLSLF